MHYQPNWLPDEWVIDSVLLFFMHCFNSQFLFRCVPGLQVLVTNGVPNFTVALTLGDGASFVGGGGVGSQALVTNEVPNVTLALTLGDGVSVIIGGSIGL